MADFGKTSNNRLITSKSHIQLIMRETVKRMDCTVVECSRSAERQHEHWKKGRKLISPNLDSKKRNSWVIDNKKEIVTYKDGYEKLSNHQPDESGLSDAIDIVPYPTMWNDSAKMHELAGVIKTVQQDLFDAGKINKILERGYDIWNGFDAPHWQTIK